MLRFAPSPTGFLHMGNVRVALLNYLFAKKNSLNFFLRIDDTDQERSKEEFVDSIVKDLSWLGIDYSDIIKQSDRKSKYNDAFNFLKKKKYIYPCFESADELALKRKILLKQGKPPIYDRASLNLTNNEIRSFIQAGQKPHWRLKLDDDLIEWNDMIHGLISFNNLSISDPVVFRSDELPLFTITSVVDDADMKVSHILRGDDHITNTAAQIKIFKLLDSNIPTFGHFPLMKSKSGKGLSKRSDSLSVRDFRSRNVFTIVILNYLKKIGTNESIEEFDGIKDLINYFDLNKFSKSSVFFDPNDVERLNLKFLKSLDVKKINEKFKSNYKDNFWKIIRSNIESVNEIKEWDNLINKDFMLKEKIILNKDLKEVITNSIPEKVDKDFWVLWTNAILNKHDIKPKELYITLRKILTGKKFGPSMNDLLTLIKKDEIINRVKVNCEEAN